MTCFCVGRVTVNSMNLVGFLLNVWLAYFLLLKFLYHINQENFKSGGVYNEQD